MYENTNNAPFVRGFGFYNIYMLSMIGRAEKKLLAIKLHRAYGLLLG